MATYSTRLAAGTVQVSSNRVQAFVVPAGHRIVVRTIAGQAASGSGVALLLYLAINGPLMFRAPLPASSENSVGIETRVVYHENEACFVRALVANVDYSLHGYLLLGSGGPLSAASEPATSYPDGVA